MIADCMPIRGKAKGAPVEFVFPKEGVWAVTEPVAILSTANNPQAAKAFVDFLVSKNGREVAVKQGYVPVRAVVPRSRLHFRRTLQFSQRISAAKDLKERAAAWIYFMSGDKMSRDYRYHARQITNRVVYPPWWFRNDIQRYLAEGDPNVAVLARRAIESAHANDEGRLRCGRGRVV